MSHPLYILLLYKWIRTKHQLTSFSEHSKLKSALIVSFVLGYFFFGFIFMKQAFHFMLQFPFLGNFLIERVFQIYFCFLFFMLVVSSFILTFSSVFSHSETSFLMLFPTSSQVIFFQKYLEVCFFSSWAFIFLSIPIFLSYGVVKEVSLWSYFISIPLLFAPFILMSSALGFSLAFVWIRFFYGWKGKILLGGGVTLFVKNFFLAWTSKKDLMTHDFQLLFNMLLKHTEWATHPINPSTWLSQLFFQLLSQSGFFLEKSWALKYVLFFSVSSLCLVLMLTLLFFIGFSTWSSFHSRGEKNVPLSLFRFFCAKASRFSFRSPSFFSMPIFLKDVQLFFREPVQYVQFTIFFGILALYILNLKNMAYDIEHPFWKNLITYLNLGSVCLTLSALSTRFFFPLISSEGRCVWLLGLSAYRRKEILFTKFLYCCVVSNIIIVCLTLISNQMLHVKGETFFLTLFLALMASFTLSALAVGLGALFPHFKASNAAEVISGFGGTFTLLMSGLYISVLVGVPAVLGHLEAIHVLGLQQTLRLQWLFLFLFFIFSLYLSYFLLKKGGENFEQFEI